MASEMKPCQIADALQKWHWSGASIGNKAIVSLAIEALRNTRPAPVATPADATDEMVEAALAVDWDNEDARATVHNIWHAMTAKLPSPPAPAATDTGLETVGKTTEIDILDANNCSIGPGRLFGISNNKASIELVTRSQAEELLAAERARSVYWAGQCGELFSKVEDLKADNAAQAARIKELEDRLEFDPGGGDRIDALESALEFSRHGRECVEAKLAAAEKALEFYRDSFKYHPKRTSTGINVSEWKPTQALLDDCGETARAVLEGKPS